MSKKAIIWTIIILAAMVGAYWYISSTASAVPGSTTEPVISPDGTDITSSAATEDTSGVVLNAVIPQPTSNAGQAPVFEQAPPGTERGGENPPVTDKPVVNADEKPTPSTTPYKPPVTDRPVVEG